jgi:hypothetical protein
MIKIETKNLNYEKKTWNCDICGKKFIWNSQAKWWGIIEDKKGKLQISEIVCSNKCFLKSKFKDKT